MSAVGSSRGKLGGLGALVFLGSLIAIAFYVQSEAVPVDDVRKTSAAALPQPEEPTPIPTLPWQDRLDVKSAKLVAFAASDTVEPAPESIPKQDTPPTDPSAGLLVQDLSDGHRILFTLDPVMQDTLQQIFDNREVPYAAAVAVDLKDNAVLVFVGHSSADPQVEAREVVTTAWAPAASVFKLVTAAALLHEQRADTQMRVCFSGGLHGIEDELLRDDPARDKQCATLGEAIAHSYNVVIGKLALRHLSEQDLAAMTRRLLFEQSIPFEYPIEPSPAHIPADPTERAKVAAGFWNVDLSPMHAAVLTATLAREGLYQPPHIIAQVVSPDGVDVTPDAPRPSQILNEGIAREIGQMMVATTTQGTARLSFRDARGHEFIPGVSVAGKTGSLTGKRAPGFNYNWFVGFAPAERPEIAFAVVLANDAKWRIKAHYAGRRLLQVYLERREAIARQREARLGSRGLELPLRDPSGAIIATANAAKDERKEAVPPGKTMLADLPSLDARDDPPTHEASPLPPVPGPLPSTTPGI